MATATLKTPRKWSRLSVRGMMLVVLAVALGLGWQLQRIREQREAVEAVRKFGGWVYYDHDFVGDKPTPGREPRAPRWLRERLGDEPFQTVRMVSLVYDDLGGKRSDNANTQSAEHVLEKVARLPGVRELLLCKGQTTDDGLRYVGRMADLEQLYLWHAGNVTDRGVAHLERLDRLELIHLSSSQITDDSLVMLSGLPRMEKLSLQHNRFTNAGLSRLRGEDRLKQLVIGGINNTIDDAGIPSLRSFRKLEMIDLQNAGVTGPGLDPLRELPNLKELWLPGTGLYNSDLENLRRANPNLTIRL